VTWRSRLAAVFPAALLGLAAWAAWERSVFGVLAVVYLVPLAAYRLLLLAHPLAPGLSNLAERRFSPWWASHQVQLLYTAVPALEALLRLVPGLYSAWLRLWGGRIGRGVYWTPRMEVHDRGLLEIGDGVIFGHKVELYGHTIMPKGRRLLLYSAPVTIGDGAFVGAGSRLAPGVVVEAGAVVPILTDLYMNSRFAKEEHERSLRSPRPA